MLYVALSLIKTFVDILILEYLFSTAHSAHEAFIKRGSMKLEKCQLRYQ